MRPWVTGWLGGACLFAALVGACGKDSTSGFADGDASIGDGAPPAFSNGDGAAAAAALTIEPPEASVTVEDGAATTTPFKAIAHPGGGALDVTREVAWTVSPPGIGTLSPDGVYTTSGRLGGVVHLSAVYKGARAAARLTVKLHVLERSAPPNPALDDALRNTTTDDSQTKWAYPYDGTVFPRGLGAPPLMWEGAGADDVVYVHVDSPTFEYEAFARPPVAGRFDWAPSTWERFVDSTSGPVKVDVARAVGGAATRLARHTWTIASASMRGTIYYWSLVKGTGESNGEGRVMRIKPGASSPDDFSLGTLPENPFVTCTMTCHTVSADGSTMLSGGDLLGGSYDLRQKKVLYDLGGTPESKLARKWSNAALSPNGAYVIENGAFMAGPPGQSDGLWRTSNGQRVPNSGLDGTTYGMPAFSPDGSKIAFVEILPGGPYPGSVLGGLRVMDFDLAQAKASNAREIVARGTGQPIAWPTVTPDGKWVAYHRGPPDSRGVEADLYFASAAAPGNEVPLSAAGGATYPFAAGDRDRRRNFEPTFAPVAAGGYFWLVFTSRRTFGTDPDLTKGPDVVKQLWVAAIDQEPVLGKDPSHPPFLLPGQAKTLNMRGFWALDPCKDDGQGCASGTECCGGFCNDATGGAGPSCSATGSGCAQAGERCATAADCCNGTVGVQCINRVCSEPTPR
jgi:WD40-like Beta Propeller Repeat